MCVSRDLDCKQLVSLMRHPLVPLFLSPSFLCLLFLVTLTSFLSHVKIILLHPPFPSLLVVLVLSFSLSPSPSSSLPLSSSPSLSASSSLYFSLLLLLSPSPFLPLPSPSTTLMIWVSCACVGPFSPISSSSSLAAVAK